MSDMASPAGAAGPGAPFPQWAVNSATGNVAEVTNTAEKALAEATAYPEKEIFFTSAAGADAYSKSIGGIGGQDPASKALNPALNAGTQAAQNVVSTAASVGKFLGDLESRNLWLRILKGVAGIALVMIGTIHLFGGSVRGVAEGAAKTAVLA